MIDEQGGGKPEGLPQDHSEEDEAGALEQAQEDAAQEREQEGGYQ